MLDMREYFHGDFLGFVLGVGEIGIDFELIGEEFWLLQGEKHEIAYDFNGVLDECLGIVAAIPALAQGHLRSIPAVLQVVEDVPARNAQQLDDHGVEVGGVVDEGGVGSQLRDEGCELGEVGSGIIGGVDAGREDVLQQNLLLRFQIHFESKNISFFLLEGINTLNYIRG
jgi:hypothetical protein